MDIEEATKLAEQEAKLLSWLNALQNAQAAKDAEALMLTAEPVVEPWIVPEWD